MKTETLKIIGQSVGDSSVGIGSIDFEIDTGLYLEDVDADTRVFLIESLVYAIWELHDNGNICFEFSDEHNDFYFDRRFTYRDAERICKEKKK